MTARSLSCRLHRGWLGQATESVRIEGYCIVEDVLDSKFLALTRAAMYRARAGILQEVDQARLDRAEELGVLRLMMRFDPHFFRFLELPELQSVVDKTVCATAIMHLQNGFILPSFPARSAIPKAFQNRFHQDFPRVLNGYVISVNVLFAIDEFTAENGATLVVPGTQQKVVPPDIEYLHAHAVPVVCPPGSMVIFDSTLWHAAGSNRSGKDRLAINHQFTRSYLKQQIDYVRALGEDVVSKLEPRTQQLLGYYTRVVTSLDEYYRPEEARLYRRGQG